MKHIDPNSIDEWLFNHFEGNLNFEEQSQLMDFLEANPQFKEDLDLWSDLKIEEPVAEFPGMESLLVEEAEPIVELVVAGTGAAATTGVAAWFKWGAGVAATVLVGVLAFLNWDVAYEPGYQPTATFESASVSGEGLLADQSNFLDQDQNRFSSADGASINGDQAFVAEANDGAANNDISNASVQVNNTSSPAAIAANNSSAGNVTGVTSAATALNGTSDYNENNQVTNQALQSHTNSGNQSFVNGAVVDAGEGTITTANPAVANGQGNENQTNDLDKVEGIAALGVNDNSASSSDKAANDRASNRNDVLAKNTVSSDWVEGSFNDPDWAHKFLATPADENGDGRWDSNHKHAPSFKNLPSTGVWPFKVPYNGVGFTNEQRSPKFVVPEGVLLNISPALAGNSGQGIYHAQINARRQAMGTDNLQNRFMAAIDYQFEAINGALGVIASKQDFANDNYSAINVAGVYAHKIELSKKVELSPALRVGYTKQTYNSNQDRGTTIETEPGNLVTIDPAGEVNREQGFLDYSAGFHLNAEKWFGGAAVNHISEPNQNVIHTDLDGKPLERAYSAYLGTEFKPRRESDFVYSPTLLYKSQGEMNELWISNTFTYKWAQMGIGVSTEQGAKASLGWNANDGRLNIRYSIDLAPSAIQSDSYTSQELTVGLLLN